MLIWQDMKAKRKEIKMKKLVFLMLFVMSLFCTSALAQTYSTTFPLSENPISEGGIWLNGYTDGDDWGDVLTSGGVAYPASGSASFDDPTALVTGTWGNDQTVEATVYISSYPSGVGEVELRLRSNISAGVNTGYEILYSVSNGTTYHEIVRWNGAPGNFDYLYQKPGGMSRLSNGNKIKVTIIGNIITSYVDYGAGYVQQGTADITSIGGTVYNSGCPGIGFYGSDLTKYGLSDFTATGSGSQPPPPPPPPVAYYVLTVLKSGTGTGTVTISPPGSSCGLSCSSLYSSYTNGTVVKLTATPGRKMKFTGWSGAGCSGTRPCSVTMNASKTVTANFRKRWY